MITNSNGNQYQILEKWEKYLLLENQSDHGNKYVVAYNLSKDETTWQHGNYFDDLREAMRYFESKKEQ